MGGVLARGGALKGMERPASLGKGRETDDGSPHPSRPYATAHQKGRSRSQRPSGADPEAGGWATARKSRSALAAPQDAPPPKEYGGGGIWAT